MENKSKIMKNYYFQHNYPNHFFYKGSFFDCLSNDTFWVAIGSIATAFALIYTISKNRRDQRQSVKNVKKALYFELITKM